MRYLLFVVLVFNLVFTFSVDAQEKTTKYEREVAKWRAEQNNAKEVDVLLQKAANQFKANQFQAALDTYNEALKLNPNDTRIIAKINDVKLFMNQPLALDTSNTSKTDNYAALNELLDLGEILGNDSITFFEEKVAVSNSLANKELPKAIEVEKQVIKSLPVAVTQTEKELPKAAKAETSIEALTHVDTLPKVAAVTPKVIESVVQEKPKVVTVEPEKALPVKTETPVVKTEPVKVEPVKTEPIKVAIPTATADPHAEEEKRKNLGQSYPEGITEEIIEEGNKTMTKRIVVKHGKGDEYLKVQYNWGGVYYFKNSKSVPDNVWLTEAF